MLVLKMIAADEGANAAPTQNQTRRPMPPVAVHSRSNLQPIISQNDADKRTHSKKTTTSRGRLLTQGRKCQEPSYEITCRRRL